MRFAKNIFALYVNEQKMADESNSSSNINININIMSEDARIQRISDVVTAGCAYESQGYVFFEYEKIPCPTRHEYAFPGQPAARDPNDYVVWAPSSDQSIGKSSPWGHGFSTFNVERSADAVLPTL
jgi:cysteinyl-tRNA synthetase